MVVYACFDRVHREPVPVHVRGIGRVDVIEPAEVKVEIFQLPAPTRGGEHLLNAAADRPTAVAGLSKSSFADVGLCDSAVKESEAALRIQQRLIPCGDTEAPSYIAIESA